MSDMLIFVILFSGIWFFIGLIFLVIGIVMLNNRKKKEINCTSKTYGKVTDIVRRQRYDSDNRHSSSLYPVFEYNIGDLKFIKESSYGSFQSNYAIGQDIEVYYNPEDYNEYYVPGDSLPKTMATIFTIIGIVAIIIAIVLTIIIL